MKRFTAMELDIGTWGVIDNAGMGFSLIAAGMTKSAAEDWAARLNLRNATGI